MNELNPRELNERPVSAQISDNDVAEIDRLRDLYQRMRDEIGKVIIGQDKVVEQVLTCIFSRGHALLMGVPGLAKTMLVQTIAKIMSLKFSRIQFTPDLMPSDITGTEILQETNQPGRRAFEFVKGPVFANIVLADEINRTPPKTQSALLEAMQEYKITVAGQNYPLPLPFFVLATQNPIEQEGTYPLPEAQLDRFMFFIHVNYPTLEEERRIARETTGFSLPQVNHVVSGEEVMKFQELVMRIPVPEHIYDTVVDIVRKSRPRVDGAPDYINRYVSWGAGPRAVQYIIKGAKAHAVLHGNYLVGMEDVEAVAYPVLNHRILTNFQAQSEGITSSDIISKLLDEVRKETNNE